MQLTQAKEKGNSEFKKKDFDSAISEFSKGIETYNKAGKPRANDIDLIAGQLYTNRALMYHNTGDQKKVMADATYVLDNLDAKNPKALLRRATAHKIAQDWEKAVKDLQDLSKITNDVNHKNDLNFCMKKFMETMGKGAKKQSPTKSTPAPAAPKIAEVKSDPKAFKKVQIQDCDSDDSDDAAAELEAKTAQKKSSAELNKQVLDGAKAKAEQMQKEMTLSQGVPKSVTQLETDLKALK